MRGWSLCDWCVGRRMYVVPAHAGVVPPSRWTTRPARRGPRACGGGPVLDFLIKLCSAWSPRMRGWSPDGERDGALNGVVPAHAGVVPTRARPGAWPPCGPRACGGGPGLRREPPGRQVVPAHAGVVPQVLHSDRRRDRGPRACGGGPALSDSRYGQLKWSPRVRGWSLLGVGGDLGNLVVPAHAGVVPGPKAPFRDSERGPRACGGGPQSAMTPASPPRWFPRMRGWIRNTGVRRRATSRSRAYRGDPPTGQQLVSAFHEVVPDTGASALERFLRII